MTRYLIVLLFSLFALGSFAQTGDSIFAYRKGSVFTIRHILQERESLSMLAQRYYTTLMSIEAANEIDAKHRLQPGDRIYIPLTKDNYFVGKKPLDVTDLYSLYYKVGEKDNMSVIINLFPSKVLEKPMTKEDVRTMNEMHGYSLVPDQALFIGWIRMLQPDSENIARGLGYPAPVKAKPAKDTNVTYFGGLDAAFNATTSNCTNVLTEKGSAVFFEKPGKNNMYFAFHNTMPRNTIIKVTNPGNNKVIFAKVIGPIPDTKNFSNCIVAISNAAREDLGLQNETRAWVELAYPVN